MKNVLRRLLFQLDQCFGFWCVTISISLHGASHSTPPPLLLLPQKRFTRKQCECRMCRVTSMCVVLIVQKLFETDM